MKQYDKIAYPLNNDHHQGWVPLAGGPFIVLTLEELKEIWTVANERGWHIGTNGFIGSTIPADLDEYLNSKGIKI